jgi:fluoroacetyl-CoA thioesterase
VVAEYNVRHLAPTPVGRTVTANARVLSVNERLITFSINAHDGTEQIGIGTHVRGVINLSRFEQALQAKRQQAD